MADIMLEYGEKFLLTPYFYGPSSDWAPESFTRQFLSLFLITLFGFYAVYFSLTTINYFFFFDREALQVEYDKKAAGKPTKLIDHQVREEIKYTVSQAIIMTFLTTFIFVAEVRGYSKLYDNFEDRSLNYWIGSFIGFFLFTDMCIYFIHRSLHWGVLYKYIHKAHHKWIITTPFASHAFHWADGFAQGFAYHLFVFMFPFHKITYLALFIGVNLWTISIHDQIYTVPVFLQSVINGAAHHTKHHTDFSFNYGQYTTLWDKLGNSYMHPFGDDHKFKAKVYSKNE